MRHRNALLSLVLVLPLAALSFAASPAQRLASPDAARSAAWPPHPSRIVNLSSEAEGAPATLLPGQLWSAFFVPPGSTLVVTNATFTGDRTVLGEFLGAELAFRRRGSDAPSPLAGNGADPGAPLGWTFRATSQVAFRNEAATSAPLSYQLVGYLVAD